MAENTTRRSFVGAAAGLVGAVGAAALMGREAEAAEPASIDVTSAELMETPAELEQQGGSAMSLYELNRRRHELVDSKGDFTCPDGTVVPAVWNKIRALTNTYGVGCGSDMSQTDESGFDFFRFLFSEEEAQAYIEMPYGVYFTAADFAAESGRDEDACLAICEELASRNLLFRTRRAGVPYFHHLALVHGFFEYGLNDFYKEGWSDSFMTLRTPDYGEGYYNSGTAFYYAIPCDKEIVADEEGVLLFDDYEKIIARNEIIAVSPCQCRKFDMKLAGEPEPPAVGSEELRDYKAPCGHPLETCITTGEEAEYYIENGIGRQIDQAEALSILRRSVDAGMILQSAFTKDSCVICSCTGECCRILKCYQAIGPEGAAQASSFPNNSHYNLVYDKDACVSCGACVERCPMFAIEIDDEGYPTVNALCMRCGQCGMVCPAGARTLVAKDPSEYVELPLTMLDDYNLQAAYRFEHGTVY